jgi:hypothetical protein
VPALGVATTIYPVVALPIFLVAVARRRGMRAAAICLLVVVGVLAAMIVPSAIFGPDGLADAFTRQAGRPLHRESTGGAALLALHQLTAADLESVRSHGSTNFAGHTAGTLATLSALLQVAALEAIWLLTLRRPLGDELVVRASAAAVLAFVVLGKVLSPQFLVWLVPLVPLVRGRRGFVAAAVLAAVASAHNSQGPGLSLLALPAVAAVRAERVTGMCTRRMWESPVKLMVRPTVVVGHSCCSSRGCSPGCWRLARSALLAPALAFLLLGLAPTLAWHPRLTPARIGVSVVLPTANTLTWPSFAPGVPSRSSRRRCSRTRCSEAPGVIVCAAVLSLTVPRSGAPMPARQR